MGEKKYTTKTTLGTDSGGSSGLTLWNAAGGSPYDTETSTKSSSGTGYGYSDSSTSGFRTIGSPLKSGETTTTTESTEYTEDYPEFKKYSEYESPEWNESDIDALIQKYSASGVREARYAMQVAMAQSNSRNPNVKAMNMREALTGYGGAIEEAISSATSSANAYYAAKYSQEASEAQKAYEADVSQIEAENEYLYNKYLASGTTTRTTTTTPYSSSTSTA